MDVIVDIRTDINDVTVDIRTGVSDVNVDIRTCIYLRCQCRHPYPWHFNGTVNWNMVGIARCDTLNHVIPL